MKKLNLMLSCTFLFSIVLVSSSFTNRVYENKNVVTVDKFTNHGTTLNNGVGNVVTIDNGQTWYWVPDNCIAAWVPSSNARVQTATNGFINITLKFDLPTGHCDIPANGAVVKHYSVDSWAIINSNGKVVAKIVYNPNGN